MRETDADVLRARKGALRGDMTARRRAVPARERSRLGIVLRTRVMRLRAVQDADLVMLYASTAEEVDLFPLMEALLQAGKRVALPRIVGKGLMEAWAIPAVDVLTAGAFGIAAPDPARSTRVSPAEIDVIVVPGAAFAAGGERLGLGGGYYDRFLPQAARALRLALAYDFQIVSEIPMAPHDAYVDCILTERRMIRCHGMRCDKTFEEEV